MAYRFKQHESVGDGIRRIAREQVKKAISELTDDSLDRQDAVHQFRKRAKKIRGLIRLVRPALGETYQRENRWYRDSARKLSRVRDADALLETLRSVRKHSTTHDSEGSFDGVQQALEVRRRKIADHWGDLDEMLDTLTTDLRAAKRRIDDWQLDEDSFDTIAGGLDKTYRRGCRARHKAIRRPSNNLLHDWRKRTKYHWYHMRLLRNVWKPVVKARIRKLSVLSDLLGDDHDLAVLRTALLEDSSECGNPDALEEMLRLMQSRRENLQRQAHRLGLRVYAEKPRALIRRFSAYWSAWRKEF